MLKFLVRETFSVSLISGMEKLFASDGYVTIFDFLSKFFCLTVPKNFVREPFRVSLISGMENFFCFRGLCHDFRFSVEIFLSHSAEKFRR